MQTTARLFRSVGGSPLLTAATSLLLSMGAFAQSAEVSQTASTVSVVIPQQVRYTGALANRNGETVEAVFKIYATAEGGEALWTETQKVSVSADGAYSVLLGAASQSGLPQAVFAAGQARWVGVSVDHGEELPRSPLSSVAYAMKAGDAESVGGLSAANLVTRDELAKLTQPVMVAGQTQPQGVQQALTPTGSGTADYVALWTSAGNLGDSNIFQASSGFLGIGTTMPGGPLELATGATGGANATMMLEQTSAASGNYYADIGLYNTHGLIGNLSALGAGYPAGNIYGANDVVFLGGQQNATTNVLLLTNTSGALKFGTGGYAKTDERMRIGSAGGVSIGNSYVATDPGTGNLIVSGNVGVGTTAPSANLEVNGTAKFDGLITFDPSQPFPGTGTITGISTSSPLTGSGTTGTVALGLNTATLETTLNGVYAQLGASDIFSNAATFNGGIVANLATGSGFSGVSGQGTSGSNGVFGSSDTGYGVVGSSTSGTGIYGTSTSGKAGVFSGSSASNATLSATNSADASGSAFPAAMSAISKGATSVGIYAEGTEAGIQATNNTTNANAVEANAKAGNAGNFINNSTVYSTIYAQNNTLGGTSDLPTVFEAYAEGTNVNGFNSLMEGSGGYGVYGESDGDASTGSGGRSAVGVKGVTTGNDSNAMVADALGTGGYGVYAHASGAPDSGVRYASAGVYSLADTGIGVEGFSKGQSGTYNSDLAGGNTAGVWGDTSEKGSDGIALGGIVGTADNNTAGYFLNNSASDKTLYAFNNTTSGPTGLFKVFKAATLSGSCGIGDGDLSCTGQVKTLATTGGGARTVETYAMQSPENWMEDFGTGAMEGGVGVVQIDPAFAETVTGDASYHVFLTQRGDSKGPLYVTKVTAGSFEVREANGGTSSLSFDYRIVAKRRGYEAQRMVDVTDRFNAEQAETKRRMPTATAVASKGVVEPQMAEHRGGLGRAGTMLAGEPAAGVRPGGVPVLPQTPVVPKKPSSATKPLAKPFVQN